MLNLAKKDGDLKFKRGRRMTIRYSGTVLDLLHHVSNSSNPDSVVEIIIKVLFPGTSWSESLGQITVKP